MKFSEGDTIRIVNLPAENDPFNNKLARISKITDLFDRDAYEVELIDPDDVLAVAELSDDWAGVGMGIVFEEEVEAAALTIN